METNAHSLAGDMRMRPATARRRILDAARGLLQQQGYDRCTMEAVAARSGLARRTLYNQFEDRDALYRASRLEILEAFESALPTEIAADAAIEVTMERFFRLALGVLASPEHRELQLSVQRDGAIVPWLVELYAKRVDRPLRLAIEHHLLMQRAHGAIAVPDPAPHARRSLTMLKAAIATPDTAPVFDAAELAGVFVERLRSTDTRRATAH